MSVNITLDDTSPMIIWGDGWEIGSLNSDPFTPRYYGSTFRCTQTEAASGSIKFKGSGVWLYGAKRDNHGVFEVDLDGQVATLDGYDVANVPQVMLFGQGGLDPTVEHTVKFTNTPSKNQGTTAKRPWMDIDFIVIETKLGEPDALTATTRIDDASPRFTYEGSSITSDFPATKQYYAETGHLMNTAGETAKIDFIGQSVAVFGGVNFNHGDYSVTLDGGAEQVFSGAYNSLKGGAVLYLATDLQNTTHSLVLKNLGTDKANNFDLDYIEYNYTLADSVDPVTSVTTISGTATTIDVSAASAISRTSNIVQTNGMSGSTSSMSLMTASTTSETGFGPVASATTVGTVPTSDAIKGATGSEEKSGTSPGLIAGAAVGGAIALILLGAILYLLKRKNRREEEPDRWQEKPIVDLTSDDGSKYPYGNGISPYSDGASATPWDSGARPEQHAGTPYGNAGSPYLSYIPPAPPSQNPSFYPHSVEPSSENGRSPAMDEQADYMHTMGQSGSYGHGAYGGIHQQRSGPSVPTTGSGGSVGEVGRALLVPVDQMYQSGSGRSLFPPGEAGYQPPEAIFGSEFSYGPPGIGTPVGSPQTRAVTALRNKGNMYSAALPPTSVAPSSAVSPDEFQNRTRIHGRAVDMGPIPVSPSISGRHELPPNYFQATEPLPSQLTPEAQSRRANMI